MPCGEWYDRLERYRRAAKTYSKSVEGLDGLDFNLAWQSAEAALRNCRTSRAALLDHEHDHACIAGDWETEDLVFGDQGQSGG